MTEQAPPPGDPQQDTNELRIRPLEEAIPLVRANQEQLRRELGVPTKAEVEDSDPRVPAIECDPLLKADEFLARTEHAEAIIVVAFASGAMPDRLVPAIRQRIQEGIPVFVLSNNPGENHGPLRVIYAAGSGAYEAGAVRLEKVNVNHHREVKAAIHEALAKGLRGQALAREIGQLYTYQDGETLPVAEWDRPGFTPPPIKDIRAILRDSGFTDDDGNYIPPQ